MNKSIDIKYTQELISFAESIAKDLQKSIGLNEYWTSFNSYISIESKLACIDQIEGHLGINLKEKKVLELGSGLGLLVLLSQKIGIDFVGIEPAANSYRNLSKGIVELFSSNSIDLDKVSFASGENLPFSNNSFDVVTSFSVIEHVESPEKVLSESYRVLKPGGYLYMTMPNHKSFIEGHFGIIWIPFLTYSKWLAKLYIKLNGFNPDFLNELNFITYSKLRKWSKNLYGHINFLDPQLIQFAYTTTKNVSFNKIFPEKFEQNFGQRFGFWGRVIKKIINNRYLHKLLFKIKLNDHIIYVLKKKS